MFQRGCEALAAGDGAVLVSLPGVSVCGSVARWLAAGPVGRYNGPRWPQPKRAAALAARTSVLTRIWGAFNMRKLYFSTASALRKIKGFHPLTPQP